MYMFIVLCILCLCVVNIYKSVLVRQSFAEHRLLPNVCVGVYLCIYLMQLGVHKAVYVQQSFAERRLFPNVSHFPDCSTRSLCQLGCTPCTPICFPIRWFPFVGDLVVVGIVSLLLLSLLLLFLMLLLSNMYMSSRYCFKFSELFALCYWS